MLAIARVTKTYPSASRSFVNFYSAMTGLSRRDWRTDGHPAPQPLSQPTAPPLEAEEDPEQVRLSYTPTPPRRKPSKVPTPHEFAAHRKTIKDAFPGGWQPPRKLSREAMEGLRSMHTMDPGIFTTPVLAEKFKISPEAVRRILKSKWEPSREQRAKLAERHRKARDEWVAQRRSEERQKQQELAKESEQKRWVKNDRLTLT